MTAQDVRRRLDGSIDVEFYRDRGLAARRAAMAGFVKGAGKSLAAAALVLVALYVVAPRDGTSERGVNTAQARASVTR